MLYLIIDILLEFHNRSKPVILMISKNSTMRANSPLISSTYNLKGFMMNLANSQELTKFDQKHTFLSSTLNYLHPLSEANLIRC